VSAGRRGRVVWINRRRNGNVGRSNWITPILDLVTLALDTTRPFLRPTDLRDLVAAVDSALPGDESDWIEWKSDISLISPRGRGTVARHILGLANRDPNRARERARGYGYLLVGAEPAAVSGTPIVDPADLDQWLENFLGADGPQWTPHWVTYGIAHVLVIIVQPPNPGDPIHTLKRPFAKDDKGGEYLAGTVFTRLQGRTAQARPAEMDMLQERLLRRASRLNMTVEWAENPAFSTVNTATIATFVSSVRDNLLATLKPAQRRALDCDTRGFLDLDRLLELHRRANAGESLTDAERDTLTSAKFGPASLVAKSVGSELAKLAVSLPDDRSPSEFEDEVGKYVDHLASWIHISTLKRMIRDSRNRLLLRVRNLTDRNFTAVQVTLHIPGKVAGVDKSDVNHDRPTRPNEFGKQSSLNSHALGPSPYLSSMHLLPSLSGQPSRPKSHIDNSGSATIRFLPVDLRPLGVVNLDSRLALMVGPTLAGEEITMRWSATASDVDGVQEGSLSALIAADPEDPDLPEADET
jgi:hypothetical protein